MKLNTAILGIQPSATLAIASLAKQMTQQGLQVSNFSAGEPDFDTPDFIKESCCEALRKGQTKYTPVNGIPRLCELIAAKLLGGAAVAAPVAEAESAEPAE